MDKTGFRIGVGKGQLIMIKRKKAYYFGLPDNKELNTAMKCITANGQSLPEFLILTGQLYTLQWYNLSSLAASRTFENKHLRI